jgi:hypothetical protein
MSENRTVQKKREGSSIHINEGLSIREPSFLKKNNIKIEIRNVIDEFISTFIREAVAIPGAEQ